jgi:drug/metabolite transporter (DMT)-like permease
LKYDFVSLGAYLSLTAFLLVVIAALAHSTWNLLAKRAAHSKHLIWFSSVTEALLFLPVAAWTSVHSLSRLGLKAGAFLFATGVLHLLYTESLLRGYRAGDLSVVYPLARGTGPLLSFFGAILLLGERPSMLAGAGALLVTSGVLLLAGGLSVFRRGTSRAGLFWGIATGITIACYTLVDGYCVRVLLLSPFLVEYAGNLLRTLVLSVLVSREDASPIMEEYHRHWKEALGIAVLTMAGYTLVLFAMTIAPISHVAPLREMSMMIGAYFGIRFFGERNGTRRVIGSALIAVGVAGLTLG